MPFSGSYQCVPTLPETGRNKFIISSLEIPARAFFKDKIKEVKVENYPLMTIPTLFAAILTVIIFFYIEPIKNLTNLITSS